MDIKFASMMLIINSLESKFRKAEIKRNGSNKVPKTFVLNRLVIPHLRATVNKRGKQFRCEVCGKGFLPGERLVSVGPPGYKKYYHSACFKKQLH